MCEKNLLISHINELIMKELASRAKIIKNRNKDHF